MDYINIIGFMAAIGTTAAFIPQVIQSLKTKSTTDINLAMYIIFSTGVFLWLVYGLLIHSYPVILANFITLIIALAVLLTKVHYG